MMLTIKEKYNIKSKHNFLIKSMTKPNKYHLEPPNWLALRNELQPYALKSTKTRQNVLICMTKAKVYFTDPLLNAV